MADVATVPEGGEKSLHERILGDVEGRILSGEWPPGYRIPFEYEMTARYNCSRMTVNKALTELVKKGLIERRRRSGSFVMHPHGQSAVLEIQDIRREVEALGLPYRLVLESREVRRIRPEDRLRLDLPRSGRVLDVSCCHFAGNAPFCLEQRLINLAAVPEAEHADFSSVGPGTWLVKQVPWSAAEHRIRAVAADRPTAALLDIAPGTACLVIARRTWSGTAHITHVVMTYPGLRHELVAQFSPASPG